MTLKLIKVNDDIPDLFLKYRNTLEVVQFSEAKVARAFSRIERANRLRSNLPKKIKQSQFAMMAIACELELEGYKHLTLLPDIRRYFKIQLDDIKSQLIDKMKNEKS